MSDSLEKTVVVPAGTPPAPRATPHIPDHTLLREIGSGAYGEVWLAKNVMGTFRAVKIVYRETFHDERPYEREFAGIKKFEPLSRSHEGLMDILQIGRNDEAGCFYYVMELADDEQNGQNIDPETYRARNLWSELQRRGALPFEECLQLGLTLSGALGHLHKNGLIHRDIKPSNIIFVNGLAQLADIGLVADASDARTFVGTEGFIPPEGPGTVQADIYSLGKVFYEMATGKDRLEFPELPTHLGGTDTSAGLSELNEVIIKCCDSELSKRYKDCDELYSDLILLESGKSVRHLRGMERRLKSAKRIGMAVALIALLAVGGFVFAKHQADRAREVLERETQLRKDAEAERERAAQQEKRAEDLSETLSQNLYAARINLAHQAYDRGNVPRALDLLESLQPAPGGEDMRGFEWFHLWHLCHSEHMNLTNHQGFVRSVVFSPDGSLIATAGDDGLIRLWERSSGRELKQLRGHLNIVTSVAFSPDANHLISGGSDCSVRLWDVNTGVELHSFLGHSNAVNAVIFSPDGKRIYSASGSVAHGSGNPTTRYLPRGFGDIRIWDVAERKPIGILPKDTHSVIGLSCSPDGKFLASACRCRLIHVFDIESGKETKQLFKPSENALAVAFSPLKNLLAVSGGSFHVKEGDMRLWNVDIHDELPFLKQSCPPVYCMAFSPDGEKLATGGRDQVVRVWDMASGREENRFQGHMNLVASVAFSPDGQSVASASWDGTVKIWPLNRFQRSFVISEKSMSAYSIAFSQDSKWFAAGGGSSVYVYNASTGERLKHLTSQIRADCIVAISPDGKTLAGTGSGGYLYLWNTDDWSVRSATNLIHKNWSMVFSHDSKTLVTGGGDARIRLWDVASGELKTILSDHVSTVATMAFTPDGQTLISGSWNEMILWEWDGLKKSGVFGAAARVAVSPNGTMLAFTGPFKGIRLVEFPGLKPIRTIPGHEDSMWSMSFSPDSRTLATASWDGTTKLWHVASGEELFTYQSRAGVNWSVVFSPNGEILATGSGSSTGSSDISLLMSASRTSWRVRSDSIRETVKLFPIPSEELISRIPPPDPNSTTAQIDLSRYFNGLLKEGWIPPSAYGTTVEKNFGNLPSGLQQFCDVDFDIRGIVQLGGRPLMHIHAAYPAEVFGIPISARCRTLHFLHGTAWRAPENSLAGKYVVTYTDNREISIPLRYGVHFRDWNFNPLNRENEPEEETVVAWTGKNSRSNIRIYKFRWENPYPDTEIANLRFVSEMFETCPFLLAITAE